MEAGVNQSLQRLAAPIAARPPDLLSQLQDGCAGRLESGQNLRAALGFRAMAGFADYVPELRYAGTDGFLRIANA